MAETTIGEVKLLNVRASFMEVFEPAKEKKNEKTGEMMGGKYKCNFLLEKDTPDTKANLAKCKAGALQAKKKVWGEDESKHPKLKPNQLFLRDGDLENWEGYEGCFYVSANSNEQPVLIDRVRDATGKWMELTKDNGGTKKLYSGCRVNAIIRIWAQDSKDYGKRVNCEVKAIQFVRHDTAFSGATPVDPNEAFGDDDVGADDFDVENGVEDDDSGLV